MPVTGVVVGGRTLSLLLSALARPGRTVRGSQCGFPGTRALGAPGPSFSEWRHPVPAGGARPERGTTAKQVRPGASQGESDLRCLFRSNRVLLPPSGRSGGQSQALCAPVAPRAGRTSPLASRQGGCWAFLPLGGQSGDTHEEPAPRARSERVGGGKMRVRPLARRDRTCSARFSHESPVPDPRRAPSESGARAEVPDDGLA